MPDVTLRDVRRTDLGVLYEHQLDPASAAMAGTPRRGRHAWEALWEIADADPAVRWWAIEHDGAVAGLALSFPRDGVREVGYRIARELWGRGLATAALRAVLELERERPLHARVLAGNAASLRVLERAGFVRVGEADGLVTLRLGA